MEARLHCTASPYKYSDMAKVCEVMVGSYCIHLFLEEAANGSKTCRYNKCYEWNEGVTYPFHQHFPPESPNLITSQFNRLWFRPSCSHWKTCAFGIIYNNSSGSMNAWQKWIIPLSHSCAGQRTFVCQQQRGMHHAPARTRHSTYSSFTRMWSECHNNELKIVIDIKR